MKFLEPVEIPSVLWFLKQWTSIHHVNLFKIKKIDGEIVESDQHPTLQSFFPRSITVEKGKNNEETVGIVKVFLLPKVQFFYRIKVVSKSKKSLFEKNVLLVKYEFKVLFGVKMDNDTPEIFKNDRDFVMHCVRVLFCYMFSPFYGQSRRIFENRLETLKEEDENIGENSKMEAK